MEVGVTRRLTEFPMLVPLHILVADETAKSMQDILHSMAVSLAAAEHREQ